MGARRAPRGGATLGAATDALVVVVGHEGARGRAALDGLDAQLVMNDEWADGLAASVRALVAALEARATAVVIALGDQPELDRAVIDAVIARWRQSGLPIVAARYRGAQGHPVLFGRPIFRELAALSGDRGAKSVIERDAARVAYVDVDAPMPRDVDRPADLARLARRSIRP